VRNASKGGEWAALGCEVALANMEDGLALSDAFAGATATFILPPPLFDPEPGYPEARAVIDGVVEALTKARPAKVLCLSTIGADAVHDNLLSQRMMMERALRKLPLPLMILRPAWFIDNAASDLASECETGLIHTFLQPACKAFPMVAAKDVGRLAADLIQEAWIDTRVVELEGAARVSPNDLARAFATVLERPVRVETVPRESWEQIFRSQGTQNPLPRIRMLDGFNEGWIEFSDCGRSAVKGTTTLDSVIAELVEASRAKAAA